MNDEFRRLVEYEQREFAGSEYEQLQEQLVGQEIDWICVECGCLVTGPADLDWSFAHCGREMQALYGTVRPRGRASPVVSRADREATRPAPKPSKRLHSGFGHGPP